MIVTIRRLSLASLAASAWLPAMDLGMSTTDVRLNLGVATPVVLMQVNGITTTTPASDQRLDAKRKFGPHVGLVAEYAHINDEGLGYFIALEGAWDHHLGTVRDVNGAPTPFATDGADMMLDTVTGTIFLGPSFQADLRDMGTRADSFRIEMGPTAGFGTAQAAVAGNNSQSGTAWSVGGQVAFVMTTAGGINIALGGGYEYTRARIAWDNTGDSDATAQGPIGRLGIGYRW